MPSRVAAGAGRDHGGTRGREVRLSRAEEGDEGVAAAARALGGPEVAVAAVARAGRAGGAAREIADEDAARAVALLRGEVPGVGGERHAAAVARQRGMARAAHAGRAVATVRA